MQSRLPLLAALFAALLLAILASTPPQPKPASAAEADFSAERAMADVRIVAAKPHVTGSTENAAVRTYLQTRMASLGMEVSTSTGMIDERGTEIRNRWSGRSDPPQQLVNVIGVLPGKDRSLPAVALMAHHDTVWGSPGAADDTAGVAAILEVVRAVNATGQPQRDLIVLLTDGEELGLQGARQFFAAHPLRSRIGAVINLEARGGGGRTSLFQTSGQNGLAVATYADEARRPVASSLSAFIYSVLPNNTDLTPVIDAGYTAYNFAFIGRSGLYHSPMSTPDNLDQGSLQDMGGQTLDLTKALLAAQTLPAKAADVVFFDAYGLTTIVYPAWLGWIMLVLTTGCLALAVRQHGSIGLGNASLRMLALMLVSGVLLFGFNRLSTGFGGSEYYDRLAAIPQLELLAMLVAAASFLLTMGRWQPGVAGTVGAAIPLTLLGAVLQFYAPTAAYIVVLPVLLVAIGLAFPWPWLRWLMAALVFGYMLALAHFLMQGVGPDSPHAASLPFVLGVLALLPLWTAARRGPAGKGALGLLAVAAVVSLCVHLDPPAATAAVYADTKGK